MEPCQRGVRARFPRPRVHALPHTGSAAAGQLGEDEITEEDKKAIEAAYAEDQADTPPAAEKPALDGAYDWPACYFALTGK